MARLTNQNPVDTVINGAGTGDIIVTGYENFNDFVRLNNYQYGLQRTDTLTRDQLDASGIDVERSIALYAAQNIENLDDDSVAINQTINTAVVALAESDPDDPNAGQVHYVAFMQSGADSRTYLFTENITINPDGTIKSQMEAGRGWDMIDLEEQQAFRRLTEKFGQNAAAGSSPFTAFTNEEGMALGGVESPAGEYKVTHGQHGAAISSASELNAHTGIEVTSAYTRSGGGQVLMKIFRQSAEGALEEAAQGVAAGHDNDAKYQRYDQMQPGINTIAP